IVADTFRVRPPLTRSVAAAIPGRSLLSLSIVCGERRLGNTPPPGDNAPGRNELDGPRGKAMRGRELLARLREEVLLGDGALGTMLSERGVGRETNYERLNLTHPEIIQDLHGAYVDAGAGLI